MQKMDLDEMQCFSGGELKEGGKQSTMAGRPRIMLCRNEYYYLICYDALAAGALRFVLVKTAADDTTT